MPSIFREHLKRRLTHLTQADDAARGRSEYLSEVIWSHHTMCQCEVCAKFYAEPDSMPLDSHCWVTGEVLEWYL